MSIRCEEKSTETVGVRLTSYEKQKLKSLAKREKMSISEWIRNQINKEFVKHF